MESLKAYLNSLPSEEDRELFAEKCGTTLGHMRNACSRLRTLNPAVSAMAALLSGGVAKQWEMRPDDWHVIWPELLGTKGSPRVKPKATA